MRRSHVSDTPERSFDLRVPPAKSCENIENRVNRTRAVIRPNEHKYGGNQILSFG
jgi:hypothetical protein